MSDAASARAPWTIGPGSVLGAGLLAALGSTWRIEHGPEFEARDRAVRAKPAILVFWHSRLLPLAWTHRGRGIAVLVSQHADGEWIARVLERLGNPTARGSSTRGGEVGLKTLLRHAARGGSLAVTPDGPRGPAERVKVGVIHAAARSGLPLVALTAAADRAWVLRSWDRFRIPQPFARVRLGYGEPIAVPRDAGPETIEVLRVRLETSIADLTREAAAAVGERHVPLPEPDAATSHAADPPRRAADAANRHEPSGLSGGTAVSSEDPT